LTDFSDPLVIVTLILAILTGYYAYETYRIRRNTERPSFSFGPAGFTVAGKLIDVHIVNAGQTAADIRMDCSWSESSKKFYIMSLGSNGTVFFPPSEVPIMNIIDKKDKLKVEIKCKDIRNKKYHSVLEVDFGITGKEGRHELFQYRPPYED